MVQINMLREQTRGADTYRRLYVDLGMSVRQVACLVDRSPTNVLKSMAIFGIESRPQKLHPDLKRDFFDCIDTPEKAYILGLIWADGTMDDRTGQIRVRLAEEDLELLEHVRIIVGSDSLREIPPSGNSIQTQYGLYLSSRKMIASLQALGLTRGKDYSLPVATAPRADLTRDFVRGLVDGDGCLKFSSGVPRIEFRNRNESLRKIVSDYWISVTGKTASGEACVHKHTGRIYPSIYLPCRESVVAASDMYRVGDLCMKRKFDKSESFKEWHHNRQ